MKKRSGHIAAIALLLFLVSPFLAKSFSLKDSATWFPMSPEPNSTISSGEVLLVVKYDSTLNLRRNSIEIFLDDYLLTTNIKVFKDKISLLYMLPLKPGEHRFEVRANAIHLGWIKPLVWTFNILPAYGPDGSVAYKRDEPVPGSKTQLTGNVSLEYRQNTVKGDGAPLRQTLPYSRNLDINTNLKAGKFNFPLRYFNTSDQYLQPSSPSRNYFQVGAQSKWLNARYGDMNPCFDRLVLPGTRVQGAMLELRFKRKSLTVLDGYLNKAMEGQLLQYSPTTGMEPYNLRADNTYINPGIYKRKITAFRFAFGNKSEGSSIGINIMRVRDDLFSIRNGESPHDNLVIGADESVVTNESKMRFNAGIAASFYTQDISEGPISNAAIDSLFGFSLPFDPVKYKGIFIINQTTRKYGKQSLAGYFNTVFHSRYNDLMLEYRYVGGGYKSLANPYLQSDLRGGIIQDRLSLWKRRILLTAKYNIQISNLSASELTFINSHLGNASVLVCPGAKLPQLSLFYNFQWRISPPSESRLSMANDMVNSAGGNISYNFSTGSFRHNVIFNYFQSDRQDKIWTGNDLGIRNSNVILNEEITDLNLLVSLQWNKAVLSNASQSFTPLYSLYSADVKYRSRKLKSDIGFGYRKALYSASMLSQASARDIYSFMLTGRYFKAFSLEVDAGFAPYTRFREEPFSYNENYVIARLSYDLNFH